MNILDNNLLELGINLRGHLTLGDVSEEFLLGGLEVLLEAVGILKIFSQVSYEIHGLTL